MAKIKIVHTGVVHESVPEFQYHFHCKGCRHDHALSPKVHRFNNNFDKPTFAPSVLFNFRPGKTCHAYINDGMIQYLPDCDHSLAGQTIELPDININPPILHIS